MFKQKQLQQQIAALEQELDHRRAYQNAIRQGMAVIEFKPTGEIVEANEAFLKVVGYSQHEIVGKHHRIFCEEQYAKSSQYKSFWNALAAGNTVSQTFQRVSKSGSSIWLEATYLPVIVMGVVESVVKIALDVTEDTKKRMTQKAMLEALDRSMATIEFSPSGEIITANANFLTTVGYSLEEVVGQHHRIFCEEEFLKQQPKFWSELAQGELKAGQFMRVTKSGEKIWLEATYNPVLDELGRVVSVVKFASNITKQTQARNGLIEAAGFAKDQSKDAEGSINAGVEAIHNVVNITKAITVELKDSSSSVADLNKQTDKIRDIVTTISEVADQTNLLALNAAIEAARAGEQGRGFAVVADEVRMLAARTSSSTIEIGDVVKNNIEMTKRAMISMEKVQGMAEEGGQTTHEAYDLMEKIKAGTSEVSKILEASHSRMHR